MTSRRNTKGLIYPRLPGVRDLLYFRISGAGLGNCFFVYFGAALLARDNGCQLVTPSWPSLKVGPLLRGERSKRFYRNIRAHPDELSGVSKLRILVGTSGNMSSLDLSRDENLPVTSQITVAYMSTYSFSRFLCERSWIRSRLREILKLNWPLLPKWQSGEYATIHVRLGDFQPASAAELKSGARTDARIPLQWYENAIEYVRSERGINKFLLISDGSDEDLLPLVKHRGVTLFRGSSDADDLIYAASGQFFIGSNSTFSQWASYLGDAPSLWLETTTPLEHPSSSREWSLDLKGEKFRERTK